MRFGLFVPQGWRLDLAGIAPAEQWPAMRDIAQYADRGPWESVWVYDHFHTVPRPTDEACHEAWTLMAALGGDRAGPAQIVENPRKLEAAGMTYGIFYFPEAAYDRSGIELFEREVIPALV